MQPSHTAVREVWDAYRRMQPTQPPGREVWNAYRCMYRLQPTQEFPEVAVDQAAVSTGLKDCVSTQYVYIAEELFSLPTADYTADA